MPAFTKGPWVVADRRGSNYYKLISSNPGYTNKNGGIYIAKVQGPDNVANARLIAAAPELYEALSQIVENTDYGAIQPRYVDAARAAIRKARGES